MSGTSHLLTLPLHWKCLFFFFFSNQLAALQNAAPKVGTLNISLGNGTARLTRQSLMTMRVWRTGRSVHLQLQRSPNCTNIWISDEQENADKLLPDNNSRFIDGRDESARCKPRVSSHLCTLFFNKKWSESAAPSYTANTGSVRATRQHAAPRHTLFSEFDTAQLAPQV